MKLSIDIPINSDIKALLKSPFIINEENRIRRDKEATVGQIFKMLEKPYKERSKDIEKFKKHYSKLEQVHGVKLELLERAFFNQNYIMR